MRRTKKRGIVTDSPIIRLQRRFSVTFNGKNMGLYSYLDKVKLISPNNTYTGFLINGKLAKFVTNITVIVTEDLNITTNRDAVYEDAALLSLITTNIYDDRLFIELYATAIVESFYRMGIVYSFEDEDKASLYEAVVNRKRKFRTDKIIGIHTSTVDSPNESGRYQFRYSPCISFNNIFEGDKLYFRTFVETDDDILFSDVVLVDIWNLVY